MLKTNKLVFIFLGVALLAGTFFGGVYFGKSQVVCQICTPSEVDFSLFWSAWNQLQEQYVNRENLDTQKMIYGAISGMVDSLGDPYTVFFPPDDSKRFKEDVAGSFDGIGIEIGVRNDQLNVLYH